MPDWKKSKWEVDIYGDESMVHWTEQIAGRLFVHVVAEEMQPEVAEHIVALHNAQLAKEGEGWTPNVVLVAAQPWGTLSSPPPRK